MKKQKKEIKGLNKKDDEKLFAFIGAFFVLVGFLIVFLIRKDDKYSMYYAKQGLVLFIAAIIFSVLSQIPLIGWIFSSILLIIWIILWIITFINSISGEIKPTFVVGELADKIKI